MRRPGSLPSPVGIRQAFRVPNVSLKSALRLWQRNLIGYSHSWQINILPNFFEPFFYLLAIGFGLGKFVESVDRVEYASYIAPGLAATSAMYGAAFDVTFNVFVKLHFEKLYDAVTVTPLSPEDVVVGEMLWAVTRSLIYGLPFVLIATLFGLVHSPWALASPMAVAAIGFCFAMIGLAFTSFIPTIDLFSFFFTLFITPMFLFSGIFFPIETLPDWAEPIAWFSPLFHAAAMFRELFGVAGTDIASALGHFAWLLGLGALLFPVAPNLFRHRLVV
ncbi:MAG: ABC transporter permease [Actinomycetota bacterium]|nr:ABC transporter permease [Actinomycetota bacterium]